MGGLKRKTVDNRYFNRRQFLLGSGSLLFLPTLVSLLPSSAIAQAANRRIKRAVFVVTQYGIDPDYFFPSAVPNKLAAGFSDVYMTPMSSVPQNMSTALASYNDAEIRSKMNLYRGLDGASSVYWAGHTNGCLAGSYESADGEDVRVTRYSKTVDVIMAKSSGFYEKQVSVPVMRVGMTGGPDDNMSFDRGADGKSQPQSYYIGDRALYNKMFGNFTGGGGGGATPTVPRADLDKRFLIDKILPDLNNLMSHRRLSSEDKKLVDQFITGLHETEKKLQVAPGPVVTCSKPNITLQGQKDEYWYYLERAGVKSATALVDNCFSVIRNSFLCDLSRIAVVGCTLTADSPSAQPDPHIHENPKLQAERQKFVMDRIYQLAKDLAATPDPLSSSGSLLDNTVIFHTNEHANLGHHTRSLPIFTIGSMGGYLKTGNYLDFRNRPLVNDGWDYGRPYKQLLISIMDGMGVARDEYMSVGKGGFGSFFNDGGAHSKYTNTHNDPLPFIKA